MARAVGENATKLAMRQIARRQADQCQEPVVPAREDLGGKKENCGPETDVSQAMSDMMPGLWLFVDKELASPVGVSLDPPCGCGHDLGGTRCNS